MLLKKCINFSQTSIFYLSIIKHVPKQGLDPRWPDTYTKEKPFNFNPKFTHYVEWAFRTIKINKI